MGRGCSPPVRLPVIETGTIAAQVADRSCLAPRRVPQSVPGGSARTPCRSPPPPGGTDGSRRAVAASQVQGVLVLAAYQMALRGDFEARRTGLGIPAN